MGLSASSLENGAGAGSLAGNAAEFAGARAPSPPRFMSNEAPSGVAAEMPTVVTKSIGEPTFSNDQAGTDSRGRGLAYQREDPTSSEKVDVSADSSDEADRAANDGTSSGTNFSASKSPSEAMMRARENNTPSDTASATSAAAAAVLLRQGGGGGNDREEEAEKERLKSGQTAGNVRQQEQHQHQLDLPLFPQWSTEASTTGTASSSMRSLSADLSWPEAFDADSESVRSYRSSTAEAL